MADPESIIPADFPTFEDARRRDPNTFMILQRNKNSNTVLYTLNIVNGVVDANEPVKVYWVMSAKGPNFDQAPTEGLNLLERTRAYGVNVASGQEGHFKVQVMALSSREFDVFVENGEPIAVGLTSSGEPARLRQVYVKAKEGWGLPKVESVQLISHAADGRQIIEVINP